MVSTNATASLEWLFEKSARENSVPSGESCELRRLPPGGVPSQTDGRQLVVLTISSYIFRIVALFSFSRDSATRRHMARLTKASSEEIDGQTLDDAFAELVNMICGTVNRRLVDYFPHVGMATPFVIESTCSNHLQMLNPSHVQAYEVQLAELAGYDLTLCLCTAPGSQMDFRVDRSEPEEESSGELELF